MNEFIVKIMLFIRQIINCLNLLKPIQKCIYLSKTQTVKLPAYSSNYNDKIIHKSSHRL